MSGDVVTTDIAIVGGGLSGLAAAWQLHRHGIDVQLLEARDRLGGRVLSVPIGDAFFDMGPSWVWHGQPHVASLLEHFALPTHEQICEGDLLHQGPDGTINHNSTMKPTMHYLRLEGGSEALVRALADALPPERVHLGTAVTALARGDHGLTLSASGPAGALSVAATQAAIATPLRLAAELAYAPPLDDDSLAVMSATPTWMAGHAKFLATYPTPFWRERGLSGEAFSQRGPLAEIHDASPSSGGPYALFGFVGIPGPARARLERAALIEACRDQLAELFGSGAEEPSETRLVDWADEPFTATEADRPAPDHHPRYGARPDPADPWKGTLDFIVTETAAASGGLIEGALERGLAHATEAIDARRSPGEDPVTAPAGEVHDATMSWDWLDDSTREGS